MSRAVCVSWICAWAAELEAIEVARAGNPGAGIDARAVAACDAYYRERVRRVIRDLRAELEGLEQEEARAEQARAAALKVDIDVALTAFEAGRQRARNPREHEDA